MEIMVKPMYRALNALMPLLVNNLHDLLDEGQGWQNVEPPVELHHAIGQGPWRTVILSRSAMRLRSMAYA